MVIPSVETLRSEVARLLQESGSLCSAGSCQTFGATGTGCCSPGECNQILHISFLQNFKVIFRIMTEMGDESAPHQRYFTALAEEWKHHEDVLQ